MTARPEDRVIARLDPVTRLAVLRALAKARTGRDVIVDTSLDRTTAVARSYAGELVGVAYAPGAACTDVLVIRSGTGAIVTVSATQIVRVTTARPGRVVLVGAPLETQEPTP